MYGIVQNLVWMHLAKVYINLQLQLYISVYISFHNSAHLLGATLLLVSEQPVDMWAVALWYRKTTSKNKSWKSSAGKISINQMAFFFRCVKMRRRERMYYRQVVDCTSLQQKALFGEGSAALQQSPKARQDASIRQEAGRCVVGVGASESFTISRLPRQQHSLKGTLALLAINWQLLSNSITTRWSSRWIMPVRKAVWDYKSTFFISQLPTTCFISVMLSFIVSSNAGYSV